MEMSALTPGLIGPNELFYGQALGERYSLRGRGQDDRDT